MSQAVLSPDFLTFLVFLGLAGMAASVIALAILVRRRNRSAEDKPSPARTKELVPVQVGSKSEILHSDEEDEEQYHLHNWGSGPLKAHFIAEKIQHYNMLQMNKERIQNEIAAKSRELVDVETNLNGVSTDLRQEGIILEATATKNTPSPAPNPPKQAEQSKPAPAAPPKTGKEEKKSGKSQSKEQRGKLDPRDLFASSHSKHSEPSEDKKPQEEKPLEETFDISSVDEKYFRKDSD